MSSRLKWTSQEEELLRTLGSSTKKNKWTQIAKLINDQLPQIQRTPKQCREKYNNHLIFGDKSYDANWSQHEDEMLFKQYKEKGPRWKIISQSFPTKSQNTIKNRFYGNVRKIVRKLNKIGKQKISKSFKPIREKSIIRIIEPDAGLTELSDKVLEQMRGLRERLIEIIQNGIEQNEPEEIQKLEDYIQLIKEIHNFNCKCRFLRNFKPRSHRKFSKFSKDNENVKSTEANQENSRENCEEENGDKSQGDEDFSDQLSQPSAANNHDKSSKEVPKPEKVEMESGANRERKNDEKTAKIEEPGKEKMRRRSSSSHFINLIHQYVSEYCFRYDKQCYRLLTKIQQ